jgi:hypothetical protein
MRVGWLQAGSSSAGLAAGASPGRKSCLAASERAAAVSSTDSMAATVKLGTPRSPSQSPQRQGVRQPLCKGVSDSDWWPSPIQQLSASRSSSKQRPPVRPSPMARAGTTTTARAGLEQRARAGLLYSATSVGGTMRQANSVGGIQAAVASCLEASARLAERELAESAWDQQPIDPDWDINCAAALAGCGDFQRRDVMVCCGGTSAAGARSSAAVLAQREDGMAAVCLQAVCDASDFRRHWRACRRRTAVLEAELCFALQADALCVSSGKDHGPA